MRTINAKALLGASLILGLLTPAAQAFDSYTVQTSPAGTIDWSERWVEAVGSGAAPQSNNPGQQRLMAERAARVDAYRNLLEMVEGVQVDAETTVHDFVTESDVIRTRVQGVVKGAQQQGQPRYLSDGTVEITLRMPLFGSHQLSGALGAERLMRKRAQQVQQMLNSGVSLQDLFASAHPQREPQWPSLPFLPVRLASAQPGFWPVQLAQQAYTGMVLDMCTLPIRPAMSPAVLTSANTPQQVYIGNFPIDPDQVISEGVLQYYRDFDRAVNSPRVGAHPLVVEAWKASDNQVDVLVSPEDAQRIQQADQGGHFLKQLKVVVASL